jgi:hypothetical protein
MLARDSNTGKSTTRNAIAQAVAIGLLKKTERRSYCVVSLPNILTYGFRRQSFWDSSTTKLKECLAHPFGLRLLWRSEVGGVQRWSFV